MLNTNKKIAIITPGGDAPGINTCIRAVVNCAIDSGFEVVGVMNGYQGLIDEIPVRRLDAEVVKNIIHSGGTMLKSSRCTQIKTPAGLSKAVKTLKKNKITHLIVIGGNGSIIGAEKISKSGISVICIPVSIDNDIFGTDETVGFDTAINTAVGAIDKIRDVAISFDCVFIIEVMGRHHGFLAVEVGLATDAEFILVPEIKQDINKICDKLKEYQKKKKTSAIIVFAEGCGDVKKLAKQISDNTGIKIRTDTIGYIQRGGHPSARSRNLASRFGSFAIDLISKGYKNRVIVLHKSEIKSLSIQKVISEKKEVDIETLKLAEKFAGY